MHVYDPHGLIRREQRRRQWLDLATFSLLWIIAMCALLIGVSLALSLAQR